MSNVFDVEQAAAGLDAIRQMTSEIWSGIAFDDDARVALRRDGFARDSVRLTGPNPFVLSAISDDQIKVETMSDGAEDEALLDLWRLYFMRRVVASTGRHDAA